MTKSRTRTISVACLNIAMGVPHSPARYLAMMRDAFSLRAVVPVGGVYGALIGSLHVAEPEDPRNDVTGEIYRFLKLDPNEPWFNAETREAATAKELRQISIPEHLLPHLQRIPFVFRPKVHRLYFVARDRKDSLAPSTAKLLFEAVLNRLTNELNYPPFEVTVRPDKGALDEVLSLASLEHIVIDLVPPNADDGHAEQERWKKKLKAQNVRRQTLRLDGLRNESIKPDKDTLELARVASHNGKVTASGHDLNGMKQELSTTDRPLIERVLVNPEVETVMLALKRTADVLGTE